MTRRITATECMTWLLVTALLLVVWIYTLEKRVGRLERRVGCLEQRHGESSVFAPKVGGKFKVQNPATRTGCNP